MASKHLRFKLKLSERFVLVSLTLLLAIQITGFFAARAVVQEQIETEVRQSLNVSSRVWQQLLAQTQSKLFDGASVLAADFGFRSAVATGDEPTVSSALLNSAERIGASVAFFIDLREHLAAASVPISNELTIQFNTIMQDIQMEYEDDGERNELLSFYNGKPTQFIKVPVKAPGLIGHVLMGFTINQARVDELNRLSGSDIVLWTSDKIDGQNSLVGTLDLTPEELTKIPLGDHSFQRLNEEWLVSHQDIEFFSGTLHLFLFGSLDVAESAFDKLQFALGLITLGGIVIFSVGTFVSARRVTRPLVALTEATESLGRGEFDIKITGTSRNDEIGTLANGFDRMRENIQTQRERIYQLAYFDQLTGLPNRLKFVEFVREGVAGGNSLETPIIVLTINLDRFKQVNDVLGYDTGDHLLQATGRRMQEVLRRRGDMLARVAGDEFAVVLTRTDVVGAKLMANKIQAALSQPLELNETQIDLSASIGIASVSHGLSDANALVNASQLAMYAAKSRREDILEYSPELESSTPDNLNLLTELRRAVKENELRIFLQPKVETKSDRVVAAEALIRWQHPINGMVAPYKFVPFAEQTGFVRELTRWMIDRAASIWHELQPRDHNFRISVNLSTRDLLDPHLPDFLDDEIRKYDLKPSALCLEITESAIMDDPKLAEETLNTLSQQGFRLSIDDFGTGYSSLGYLKRLPVNELKVDQSFVFGMMENENDAIIVRSTIDLAHNLGLDVVAEGVETQEMFEILKAHGCEEAQGYLIGKPMPVEEFKRWRIEWEAKQLLNQ